AGSHRAHRIRRSHGRCRHARAVPSGSRSRWCPDRAPPAPGPRRL
ncbi:MAG: hypothetical protein AVDCRST_MAG33-2784, partial [uncultured Thermomicrobiales bacterium]